MSELEPVPDKHLLARKYALLPASITLTLLMAFASDVIIVEFVESPASALAMTCGALAALSMAGAVLSAAFDGARP